MLFGGEPSRAIFWSQTLRSWKNLNASEIHARRHMRTWICCKAAELTIIGMEAALPRKLRTKKRPDKLRATDGETKESSNIQKTKHACIEEAHESTRKRLGIYSKNHEDHIAEKGFKVTLITPLRQRDPKQRSLSMSVRRSLIDDKDDEGERRRVRMMKKVLRL